MQAIQLNLGGYSHREREGKFESSTREEGHQGSRQSPTKAVLTVFYPGSDSSTKESSISPERQESTNFTHLIQEPDGVPRRKESFTRLYDSTKHSGAPVVGSLFDCPTVGTPGSRQAHQPYDEGPRKAQGGRRAAQDSRR